MSSKLRNLMSILFIHPSWFGPDEMPSREGIDEVELAEEQIKEGIRMREEADKQ
jgi:hypothetical protein